MKSVRARLTAFTILLVAGAMACMGLALHYRVYADLIDEIDRQLSMETDAAKQVPAGEDAAYANHLGIPDGPNLPGAPSAKKIAIGNTKMFQVLRAPTNVIQLEMERTQPRLIPVGEDGSVGREVAVADAAGASYAVSHGRTFRDFADKGEPMRSLSVPIRSDGRTQAIVQSVRSLAPATRQVAELDRAMALSIPVAILVAAISGAFLVVSAMRPLRRLTDSARKLEDDLSGARLPTEGGDEFAQLAKTFNEAFDRTSAAFRGQRLALEQLERFTGDAGHELRTPLASIKGSASYLLHLTSLPPESVAALQGIDRSSDRMAKLISDLLLLARQDGGKFELDRAPANVATLVQDAIEDLAIPPHIALNVRIDPDLEANVDAESVRRVVINLVGNAVVYARSRVEIVAQASSLSLPLTITVSDDGAGIAPEHLARLGERFYRPDESRSRDHGGAGLGLAIAKGLCDAHGGSLDIKSKVDCGTTVTATFAASSRVDRQCAGPEP